MNSQPNDSTYINYEEEDDFIDETFEGTEAASTLMTASNVDSSSTGYSSEKGFPIMCLALYDFEVRIIIVILCYVPAYVMLYVTP